MGKWKVIKIFWNRTRSSWKYFIVIQNTKERSFKMIVLRTRPTTSRFFWDLKMSCGLHLGLLISFQINQLCDYLDSHWFMLTKNTFFNSHAPFHSQCWKFDRRLLLQRWQWVSKILIRITICFSCIGLKKIQLNYSGNHFALALQVYHLVEQCQARAWVMLGTGNWIWDFS